MHKLSAGVSETVQVLSESHMLKRCLEELRTVSSDSEGYCREDDGITYEQLQAIIENLVVEHGYYHSRDGT